MSTCGLLPAPCGGRELYIILFATAAVDAEAFMQCGQAQ